MNQSLITVRYEWKAIPWRKLEVKVFKLQKRIYRASMRGDVKLVHRLQRLLVKSWSAKILAVRKVTQDNQGKKTAGVDGIKSLSPKERLEMVMKLEIKPSKLPTRRVWIPKPGTDEKRPLGILVIQDRAIQAMVKNALEPEWEATFERSSYGLRPGRSPHDAIASIYNLARPNKRKKWVVDADIQGCFDNISHNFLLERLTGFPARELIKQWLLAGYMEAGSWHPTDAGTPQGSVVSPLLANIALHGMES
ncbi:reverse transcriptase N-terminal domain-containing protein, partial [Nostoc sp. NZL]|uniref:reverse transcriptase N-terminal domain-containing protein n=1 Tax=Nostoc sp. NZL TaxID=2650612 RepID=UPI0018C4BAE8